MSRNNKQINQINLRTEIFCETRKAESPQCASLPDINSCGMFSPSHRSNEAIYISDKCDHHALFLPVSFINSTCSWCVCVTVIKNV